MRWQTVSSKPQRKSVRIVHLTKRQIATNAVKNQKRRQIKWHKPQGGKMYTQKDREDILEYQKTLKQFEEVRKRLAVLFETKGVQEHLNRSKDVK